MHSRAIRRTVVNHSSWIELIENRFRAPDMQRVAVAEDETIEPIDPPRVQRAAQNPLIVTHVASVEEPIRAPRAQMHGGAGANVEHGNLRARPSRPMRPVDVNVTGGQLRKNLHQTDKDLR